MRFDRDREAGMVKWNHIEPFVDGCGTISIGRIGPHPCAAVAFDEDQQLVALVRRPKESLEALLVRLNKALGRALDDDEYTDEVNE